jgi:hypothetical protein
MDVGSAVFLPKKLSIEVDMETRKVFNFDVNADNLTRTGKVFKDNISTLYLAIVFGIIDPKIKTVIIDNIVKTATQTVLFNVKYSIKLKPSDVVTTPTATTDIFMHTKIVVMISSGFFSQT